MTKIPAVAGSGGQLTVDTDTAVSWAPALALNVIDDTLTAPPVSHTTGDAYIPQSPAQGLWTGLEGHLVEWSGSAWADLKTLVVGDHFLVSAAPAGGSSFNGHAKALARVTALTPTYLFTAPEEEALVLIAEGNYAGTQWYYDGAAWTEVTGGSGETYSRTQQTVTNMAPGSYVDITHPSYALTGRDFYVDVGISNSPADGYSTGGYWTILQDLIPPGGISWVSDGVCSGHFDVDPGDRVQVGCWINGGSTAIATIAADPTQANSVTLAAGYDLASGPISALQGSYANSGALSLTVYNDGNAHPVNYAYYGTAAYAVDLSSPEINQMKAPYSIVNTGGSSAEGRIVWSLDAGTTWKYYNGSNWVTADLDNLVAGSCRMPAGYSSTVLDSTGTALTDAAWRTFIGVNTSVLETVAVYTTDSSQYATVSNTYYPYTKTDLVGFPSVGFDFGGMAVFQFAVQRLSSTQVRVTNKTYNTISSVRIQVRIRTS